VKRVKLKRIALGRYDVIDTKTGATLKTDIANVRKAAGYVDYYNEEIEKGEKFWFDAGKKIS
jgi:delta 1-pyrroline-5-carboxylate dehydrogenase